MQFIDSLRDFASFYSDYSRKFEILAVVSEGADFYNCTTTGENTFAFRASLQYWIIDQQHKIDKSFKL